VFATPNTALAIHVQFQIKQALDSEIKGKGRMSYGGLLLKPLSGLIKSATHSGQASFRKKWLSNFFLNDNKIYVTTKFMHSTQILVPVLAKKTFVCTLSESISNAVNTPPQK